MAPPASIVWKLFIVDEEEKGKAVCKICDAKISRGKTPGYYTTTNMLKHLSTQHNKQLKEEEEKEAERKEAERKRSTMLSFASSSKKMKLDKQPTIAETLEKKKLWDINDSRAQKYHKLIGEMIAVDMQPFSMVDDLGFTRLVNAMCPNYNIPGRKFFKEKVLQDMHTKIKNNINLEVSEAKYLSFTSDGWTTSTSNLSFLSLTGHWINQDFQRKTAVLRVVPFPSSHTAVSISNCLNETMEDYNINNNKIHVIVRDNAANMAAGVTQAGYDSLPCFIHTLQLVLNDAIFEQKYVKDIVAISHKIVGHFNHSPSASHQYEEYQKKFDVPVHKFIQDVSTRWNSQYLMMTRLIEQKTSLIGYCSDHSKPSCLDANQWKIIEKLVKILKNFDDCTREMSSRDATASLIIPNIQVICRFFEKGEEKGLFTGLGSTLSAWKMSVKNRFQNYLNDKNLIIATYLDPRFKMNFLDSEYQSKKTFDMLREWLTDEMCSIPVSTANTESVQQDESPILSDPSADEKSDGEIEFNFSFSKYFSEFKSKSKEVKRPSSDREPDTICKARQSISTEMQQYEKMKSISKNEDPLKWWDANKASFPTLSMLIKKFLSAPPSSVESERLFSIGGNLYSPKRNRMAAETGEMLMFLHFNLHIMGFNYD